MQPHPPTDFQYILSRLDSIDPKRYAASRNFIHGAVTQLSPYISRGVLDTRMVFDHLVNKGFSYYQLEKFIQQLCWREFFQRVWQLHGASIKDDIKQPQEKVAHQSLPTALINAHTGISVVDEGIKKLTETGMMHNHMRMYCAFLSVNIGRAHWLRPAQWMYYYLLDGDWASNALSWQWVAGTFSNKKYIANQENINRYTGSSQRNSYIDLSYEELAELDMPDHWKTLIDLPLGTQLPSFPALRLDSSLPLLVYNYYNVSPLWRKEMVANRVLLLEPSHFQEYPVSEKCIEFVLELAKNIEGIQVFVGSFDQLKLLYGGSSIYFKEHPLNRHYTGKEDPRNWIVDTKEVSNSFFSFWKKNEKGIRNSIP